MKRIIRIATLLTVIALGIENIPGAKAFISEDDSTVSVNKKAKLTEYKGIRVDPKPIDLLWQNEGKSKAKESPDGKASYSQNFNEVFQEKRNPGTMDYLQANLLYLQKDEENKIFTCQKKLKH